MKKVFVTKNDLKRLAKQKDLMRVEQKVGSIDKRVSFVETKVSNIETKLTDLTDFIVPAIDHILEWTDDIHRAIIGRPSKRVPKID